MINTQCVLEIVVVSVDCLIVQTVLREYQLLQEFFLVTFDDCELISERRVFELGLQRPNVQPIVVHIYFENHVLSRYVLVVVIEVNLVDKLI